MNSSAIGTVLYSFPFAYIVISLVLALCAVIMKRKSRWPR